jgi:UDP-GlcNAc:undecaprenyl-phosphate/decaprenyl-phosphate GlcNAc-1-phosphate transferase
VPSLSLIVSLAVALVVVPAVVRSLADQGLVRENYRGAQIAFPAGIAVVAAALVALVPLALADKAGAEVWQGDGLAGGASALVIAEVAVFVLGVTLLGLLDDLAGSGGVGARAASGAALPRGWRGHAGAILRGRFSTGALKAVGTLGLALFVLTGHGLDGGEYLLAVAVLVLATNLFNLLDLRPGRSLKALVLLGAGLTLGTRELDALWTLGLFVGPLLVLLPLDLRERGMLGDTGSNAAGAVAGLWLVLALPTAAQLVALALIAGATVYGEFRSISALIERTPGLRHLDSIGRVRHA